MICNASQKFNRSPYDGHVEAYFFTTTSSSSVHILHSVENSLHRLQALKFVMNEIAASFFIWVDLVLSKRIFAKTQKASSVCVIARTLAQFCLA